MLVALGQILPLALAGALSSVPLVGVLTLLLGGKDRRGPAALFAAGYLLATFLMTVLATTVFASLLTPVHIELDGPVPAVLEMILGAAAFVSGAVLLRRRGGPTSGRLQTVMTSALRSVHPAIALAFGLALALRPKALLLAAGVGLILTPPHLRPLPTLIVLVVNAVLVTVTVTVPVVLALVRRDHGVPQLNAARSWLAHNAHTVTVVVLLLVGTVLIGNGLGRL